MKILTMWVGTLIGGLGLVSEEGYLGFGWFDGGSGGSGIGRVAVLAKLRPLFGRGIAHPLWGHHQWAWMGERYSQWLQQSSHWELFFN